MKKIFLLILIIALTISNPEHAFSQSILGLSTQDEVIIGQRLARDIERNLPIYRNPVYEARLQRVGYKLTYVSDRKDIDYNFQIINKNELNAFATFGGYIYIYKGAMDKAETDDELASILAHEIGHVSAKHLAKRVEQDRAFGLAFSLLDYFLLKKQKYRRDIHQVIGIGYDIIQRGYSRQDELEADKLGTRYMYKAGYNPFAAIDLLKKLKKEQKSQSPDPFENIGILRTHPYVDERIDTILSEIATIKAEESARKAFSN